MRMNFFMLAHCRVLLARVMLFGYRQEWLTDTIRTSLGWVRLDL